MTKEEHEYEVWNGTDGLPATDQIFRTEEESEQFCQEFRDRFATHLGYYLTNRMERIRPSEIILIVRKHEENNMTRLKNHEIEALVEDIAVLIDKAYGFKAVRDGDMDALYGLVKHYGRSHEYEDEDDES